MRDPQIYENAGDSFHRNGYLLSCIVKNKTMVRYSENSAANDYTIEIKELKHQYKIVICH